MKAMRNVGIEYQNEFEAVYPRLAKEFDVAYLDFFLDGVALVPSLNQSDRIHPNRS